jgi:hypothetical protein
VSGDLEANAIQVALKATCGMAWFADASVAANMAHTGDQGGCLKVKNDSFDRLAAPNLLGTKSVRGSGTSGRARTMIE